VIADDFTGACDVGIQFTKHGISTSIILGNSPAKASSALVVQNTDTRNTTARFAYQKVRRVCSRYKVARFELAYKKIDSSLRGNLGAELDAVVEIFRRHVVVCPAYPEYGRTILDGCLRIRGVPVDKTEFAKDPLSPVRTSDLGKICSHQTNEKVAKIPLVAVREGVQSLTRTILRLSKRRSRIICPDAQNRTDLAIIATACFRSQSIPCGSAGLAAEVATILHPSRYKVAVLSSSTNEATLKELQRNAKDANTCLVKARASGLTGRLRRREISRIRMLASRGLKKHDIILVCSALIRRDVNTSLIRRTKEPKLADPIANGLAAAISPLVLSGEIDGVLLTGGEMAAAFLRSIEASELALEKEILPGIPMSAVKLRHGGSLKVVTKAGGFGSRGSMSRIVRYLISQ